jgi:uncharacterized membrane protein YkoI
MRVQNTFFHNSVAAMVAFGMAMSPMLASAETGLAKTTKVSMSEARAIALKAYPGKIVKEELEHERGGSGLRYSFDLRRGKHWREIGVDAMTGHILENANESANPKD